MDKVTESAKRKTGRHLISLATVASTNTFTMELADKGAADGTVVIADAQTRGKGRLGRTWISPPGVNIYMSVLLRPVMLLKDGTLLTIMAAVACCRALRDASGLPVAIRWPNDLMVADKKIGGILTETKSRGKRIFFAVIGIGINVNSAREDFPPDVRETATSIKIETEAEHPRPTLIACMLDEIELWYGILFERGRKPLLDEWRKLTSTLGRDVKVTVGKKTSAGVAEDIDDEGMLLLKLPTGRVMRITAGDLMILR
ncbi:MAG: biotin--[acetyl-CoA-carboxylase] ligase [Thermodesulfovibrionales bacterium]|jgi:BirA family biotin operon repressor/biotin-[acetyl-CoA-carboxylase] ligase